MSFQRGERVVYVRARPSGRVIEIPAEYRGLPGHGTWTGRVLIQVLRGSRRLRYVAPSSLRAWRIEDEDLVPAAESA